MSSTSESKPVRSKERTVAFFELVRELDSGPAEQMAQADWQTMLTLLGSKPLKDRTVTTSDRILIGDVLHYEEKAHLKLMKIRDEDAWLGIYDGDAQSVDDLKFDDRNRLYETSIVSFLDFGNVIGMIQGSTSAPTSAAVAQWINGLKILDEGTVLETQAVVSHEAMQKLRKATEASRVETTVSTNRIAALEQRGSKLSSVLKKVKEDFGPMTVTIILQTSRAKSNTEGRQLLRAEAENLATAASEKEVDKARAKLIHYDASDNALAEDVNFMKQRITAKRKIGTTAADGSPIRNVSAVEAIMEVSTKHRAELRLAVGAPAEEKK